MIYRSLFSFLFIIMVSHSMAQKDDLLLFESQYTLSMFGHDLSLKAQGGYSKPIIEKKIVEGAVGEGAWAYEWAYGYTARVLELYTSRIDPEIPRWLDSLRFIGLKMYYCSDTDTLWYDTISNERLEYALTQPSEDAIITIRISHIPALVLKNASRIYIEAPSIAEVDWRAVNRNKKAAMRQQRREQRR